MKENYQIQMEQALERMADRPNRPKLLLHSCCAPCSSYVLEALSAALDIVVYYFNPNIAPREEYDRRVEELYRLVDRLPHENDICIIPGPYDNAAFMRMCAGHESDPEGGERCTLCYRLRLASAARLAAQLKCDCFTTSLTISPLKDAGRINAIGRALGRTEGVAWLPSDFKKKNGYKRSCELSALYGLYRQDYCGCVFSKRERDARMLARQSLSPD